MSENKNLINSDFSFQTPDVKGNDTSFQIYERQTPVGSHPSDGVLLQILQGLQNDKRYQHNIGRRFIPHRTCPSQFLQQLEREFENQSISIRNYPSGLWTACANSSIAQNFVYHSIREKKLSWEEAKRIFSVEFALPPLFKELQVLQCKQDENETMEHYSSRFLELLLEGAQFNDLIKAAVFVQNMKPRAYKNFRQHLSQQKKPEEVTLERLLARASALAEVLDDKEIFPRSSPKGDPRMEERQKLKCTIHGECFHSSED